MKKIIYACIGLSIVFNLHGQTLVKENKLWTNTERGTDGWDTSPYRSNYIKFTGDTNINELTYKKIWRCDDSLQLNWYNDGYIREDSTKKVYIYNDYYQSDELLYDFDLEIGDTIFADLTYIYIENISYIHLENSSDSCRQFIFSPDNIIWIESIGSIDGILNGIGNIGLTGAYDYLVCYFENDTLKYHNPEFESCFPPPFPQQAETIEKENGPVTIAYTRQEVQFHFNHLDTQNSRFIIYTINGVKVSEVDMVGEQSLYLPKNEFTDGIYLYQLITGRKSTGGQFVMAK